MPGIELKKATPCKKRAPISIFQYNTNKSLTATAHHFHFASRLLSLVVKLSYGNRNRLLIPECEEILPPSLNSTSPRPPLFDGTTRLYLSYRSPCAQRAWVTRNYKLCMHAGTTRQDKLVAVDLENKRVWYKEVYTEEKVPALEHNGKVIAESLNIIKYIGTDPSRREFGEELLSYSETFNEMVYNSFKGETVREADPAFDVLEAAFHKFKDRPFLLGHFSLVDIAYRPFVERAHIFLSQVWKYETTKGKPKLAGWIEEMNKIDAYKETKSDPKEITEYYKKRFLVQLQQ
ncbi:hypothetical protein JCGZ_16440 [Jatropha curcas]|uniref:GST N-terminal domain-containing protein n=1 Tax=Jatropha curcas TaxID=180498 RepID=A0A067JYK5_JATCU|nr:hypothetical protein JCGZ_16440 [Jatropha curcas]